MKSRDRGNARNKVQADGADRALARDRSRQVVRLGTKVQRSLAALLIGLSILPSALAHGIAGNRLFPGTLTFDDPAVADEFTGPTLSEQRHPTPFGDEVSDHTSGLSLSRLLTDSTAVGMDTAWTEHRNLAGQTTRGIGATHLFVKHQLYESDESETLLAGSVALGLGGVGRADLHAHTYSTIEPGISFGKGFGNLPDELAVLRPFAIAGNLVADFPLAAKSRPEPGASLVTSPVIVHAGLAFEFSPRYLTARFRPGVPPTEEPLDQWIPLVEFQVDRPISGGYGRASAATANPGIAYVARTWQVAAEWIAPLTTQGGSHGVRLQLNVFLDDAWPSLFGKPMLGLK